jgi:hypothetical protein
MSIANSYPIDKNIENQDLLIGTKYSNRQTVNFTVQSIIAYVNNKGKISVAGQSTWKFVTETPEQGTLSFIELGGGNTPFSSVTSLRVAITDLGDQNVVDFFSYIIGSQIMISEQNGISFFGHYKITAYTPDSSPNFYIIGLQYIGGSGALIEDGFYDISLFDPFPGDTYATTINASSTITHDLGTKDVTVQLYDTVTSDTIYADVARPTINTVTVTFSTTLTNPIRVLVQK